MAVKSPKRDTSALRKSIGKRIRVARERADLLSSRLAERIGVRYETMSRYEMGAVSPSPEKLCAIAQATGVRMEWLVTGKGAMRSDAA